MFSINRRDVLKLSKFLHLVRSFSFSAPSRTRTNCDRSKTISPNDAHNSVHRGYSSSPWCGLVRPTVSDGWGTSLGKCKSQLSLSGPRNRARGGLLHVGQLIDSAKHMSTDGEGRKLRWLAFLTFALTIGLTEHAVLINERAEQQTSNLIEKSRTGGSETERVGRRPNPCLRSGSPRDPRYKPGLVFMPEKHRHAKHMYNNFSVRRAF